MLNSVYVKYCLSRQVWPPYLRSLIHMLNVKYCLSSSHLHTFRLPSPLLKFEILPLIDLTVYRSLIRSLLQLYPSTLCSVPATISLLTFEVSPCGVTCQNQTNGSKMLSYGYYYISFHIIFYLHLYSNPNQCYTCQNKV